MTKEQKLTLNLDKISDSYDSDTDTFSNTYMWRMHHVSCEMNSNR